jgi:hypothetical protein
MAEVTRLHSPQPSHDDAELPYRVELDDGEGGRLLALSATPAVAYAAYYGAIREYFGQPMRLLQKGVVIARFKP